MIHCWRGVLTHTIFTLFQPIYLVTRLYLNPNYLSATSTSWLALTILTWAYITTQISYPFFTSPLRHLPAAPNETFPIGHFSFSDDKPLTEVFEGIVKDTTNDGLIVMWAPFYLWAQVLPTRPDTIIDALNTHNYDWQKSPLVKRFFSRVLGNGILNAEGNEHKAMRKVVAPAFSGKHVRELAPLFYSKGVECADAMAKQMKSNKDLVLNVVPWMSRVTLDIIGAAGVGKDFNTLENDEDTLARLYEVVTNTDRPHFLRYLIVTGLVPPRIMRYFGRSAYAEFATAALQLRQEVMNLVHEKKLSMAEKSEQQKDIIAIIMRSGDFSDDYLADQLLTFLAAGHDTTASALSWALYLLCIHPDCQDKLRIECNENLGGKSSTEINASVFDTETMPYLNAVCNESLRVCSPVPGTERHSHSPTKIGTQPIPIGTAAAISAYAINRSRALWGEDAETFNPERWLTGPNAATGGAVSPHAFVTFSHGPRSCVGQNFARLEMKCLLAALIHRFEFCMADPNEEVKVAGVITLKPQNGLRLELYDVQKDFVANVMQLPASEKVV